MATPLEAVKIALSELNDNEEFSTEDVVDRAENLLGTDAALYVREFTRQGLRKIASDVIRRWHSDQDDDRDQLDMLGLQDRRFAVRRPDGTFSYKKRSSLNWPDLQALQASRTKRLARDRDELKLINELIKVVEAVMKDDPRLSLVDALKRLNAPVPGGQSPSS